MRAESGCACFAFSGHHPFISIVGESVASVHRPGPADRGRFPGGVMSKTFRLLGSSVLIVGAACGGSDAVDPGGGGGGGGGGGSCPANTICMTGSAFSPTSLTVGVNVPVTWTNNSTAGHNVTFTNPAAARAVGDGSSGNIDPSSPSTSDQRQFAAAGTHAFHCTIHGTPTSGMRGTVVVQ